jgi:hypothetical protein
MKVFLALLEWSDSSPLCLFGLWSAVRDHRFCFWKRFLLRQESLLRKASDGSRSKSGNPLPHSIAKQRRRIAALQKSQIPLVSDSL